MPGQGPMGNSHPSLFPLLSGWGQGPLPPLLVASRAAAISGILGEGLVDPEEGVGTE